jgi:transcriptional regulator with XRE-family HTH domain
MKKPLTFGGFIAAKRTNNQNNLRATAERIGIGTVYLFELETGRKSNPHPDILLRMTEVLRLSDKDVAIFYDLHAKANDIVSHDLSPYIMNNDIVRRALRAARDKPAARKAWQEFINKLK